LRACILDQKGAARALASYLATGGPAVVEDVTDVLRALGELESPLFRAALAQARGDRRGSLDALGAAADGGDLEAARALGALAVEARDVEALARAHRALGAAGAPRLAVEQSIVAGAALLAAGDLKGALDSLEAAGEQPWAAELRAEIMGRWVPAAGLSDVPGVLGEMRRAARSLDDARALLATESLAVEAERPLRVAIMGEFNAGKSTFVNALLGAEIAPTGVLPTTATLHHVVFSPDPFARIVLARGPERVVTPERLRAALSEVHASGAEVQRVTVGYPLERLRHIEIIDTPGFNAPNVDHAASAREALAEVHLVIWLMDASQPWKESERAILGEVRAAGVPAQFVVNKLDRVPEAERARVLGYVGDKLAETGLVSLMPVVWASSRQALAGRLGDASALAASNWGAVEEVVEQVVSRAPALRDAALRRRARALLAPLLERARGMAAAEVEAARAEAETRASLVQAAAWLAREQAAAGRAVARALDAPRRALIDDLAPLGQGDAGASRSYAALRAAQRLAGPVASALAAIATPVEAHRPAVIDASLPAIEAALHGLVCGLPRPAEVGELSIDRLLEATLPPARGALERESARGVASRAGAAAALVLRCAALEAALRGAV
jgi:small GTP-binding protein